MALAVWLFASALLRYTTLKSLFLFLYLSIRRFLPLSSIRTPLAGGSEIYDVRAEDKKREREREGRRREEKENERGRQDARSEEEREGEDTAQLVRAIHVLYEKVVSAEQTLKGAANYYDYYY